MHIRDSSYPGEAPAVEQIPSFPVRAGWRSGLGARTSGGRRPKAMYCAVMAVYVVEKRDEDSNVSTVLSKLLMFTGLAI